jgi:hypothetical protein
VDINGIEWTRCGGWWNPNEHLPKLSNPLGIFYSKSPKFDGMRISHSFWKLGGMYVGLGIGFVVVYLLNFFDEN